MKINKNILILLTIAFSLIFTSCVQDGNFSVPSSIGNEENANLNKVLDSINKGELTLLSIADVKSNFYKTREPKQVTGNYVVKGYVTTSDESGNFYKEFYMQDKAENPTSGIRVALNLTNSNNQFNIGREVYIRLKNLYVGESRRGDGIPTIAGFLNTSNDKVDAMSANQIPNHIFRTTTTENLVPLVTKFSALSSASIGVFVKVENAHFKGANGLTYFDPTRDYDTQRTLEGCDGFGYSEFLLETSSFSNFASTLLPAEDKWGSISGIVSKNYNGSDLVMHINSPSDVDMTGSACTPLDINDFTIQIEEDFQSVVNYQDIAITNWMNIAEEGTRKWRGRVHRGNGYAELSAYRSPDDTNIGWLISPSIDMSAHNLVYLNFKTAQHHVDNDALNKLEVFISKDFDGSNVSTATWTPLNATLANQNDPRYQFKDAGLIDISSYTGNIYVGFKYTGGKASNIDGAYMIDDFKVLTK